MNKRSMNMVLRCSFSAFDTVGWVAGRAPGLLKKTVAAIPVGIGSKLV